MRLKRIKVEELFGTYKYDINLEELPDFRVAIIDAPNGMGKTTILRMIQATMNADVMYLDSIPFHLFELEFDKNVVIGVTKKDVYESLFDKGIIELRNYYNHLAKEEEIYNNLTFFINQKEYPIEVQRDTFYMLLRRISSRTLRNRDLGEDIKIGSLLSAYNIEEIYSTETLSDALNEVVDNTIYYIRANRLYRHNTDDVRDERYNRKLDRPDSVISAVELYSKKVREKILAAGKLFADRSEELDRTFPKRVLETIFQRNEDAEILDTAEIAKKLETLETQRANLRELGLVTGKADTYVKIPKGRELTRETRIFLTNYIEDNTSKLKIYRDLADELRLLRSIVNDRNVFSDKTLQFNSNRGMIFVSANGREIPISKLSSGEQNNLVLFYELIFECGRNSIILVDEPEISLHVSWQRQFIDELCEICDLKGLQGVVATHSPDIVDKYDDLMIDLVNIER